MGFSSLFSHTLPGKLWAAHFPEVFINVLHLLLFCPWRETEIRTRWSSPRWYRCPKQHLISPSCPRTPVLGFLPGISMSSYVFAWAFPEPLSLLCDSTFSSLCLLASGKWQNWEMSCLQPKADLTVPGRQQIIYKYLWEDFVSSPLLPSHTPATKRKNSGFSIELYFSQEDCVGSECCLFYSLFLSLSSHWRHLLMPIPGQFQGAVITAASTPKPKKAHEEPVRPDITETLQWIILSWCLVLVWLPPHSSFCACFQSPVEFLPPDLEAPAQSR